MGIEESTRTRKLYLRRKILDIAKETHNAHIASGMSCIDILMILYDNILTEEDKFILSKGHGCLGLYAILRDKGLNPDIYNIHPDIDVKNGIECTTGSLGHGLPVAVGMALAKKLKNEKGNIYVLMSDGECQEGTTWESLLIATHNELDNLIIIIDDNRLQALDCIDNILPLGDIEGKLESFGAYYTVVDGHDTDKLHKPLKSRYWFQSRPKVIIAETVKGRGIKFMENKAMWHSRFPTEDEFKEAYEGLK